MQHRNAWIVVALFASVLVLYARTTTFAFVAYDDPDYVSENPRVQAGPTADTIAWAFTTFHAANWHPLTWLSHAVDWAAFGQDAGGHHAVNVLLHALNAALLFTLWRRLSGSTWPAAAVAMLFAVHPLQAGVVAWVSERKELLATSLFLLALLGYERYARRPSAGRMAVVCGAFALALLAKPMVVTLPFVLLLLDGWPLRRTATTRLLVLVREKAVLFAASAASCVVTVIAQRGGAAVESLEALPLSERLANAALSAAAYLGKAAWPVDLAFFHPYRPPLASGRGGVALLAALALAAVTALAISCHGGRRRCPWLFTGWLWYLGTLVPVLGIVQVGAQSLADRYTYVPLIGIWVVLAFGVQAALAAPGKLRAPRTATIAAAVVLVAVALGVRTWQQVSTWRDSDALFAHALAVDPDNHQAHNNLGRVLEQRGETERALWHFEHAVACAPNDPLARKNLGILLYRAGRLAEARTQFEAATRLRPEFADAWNHLGAVLETSGDLRGALACYERALVAEPLHADAAANVQGVRALLQEESP